MMNGFSGAPDVPVFGLLGGDLVKECQYCNEESFYVIPIPWVHRYLTKNKKGEEKSRSEARQMKLHLCAYHYDKWRSQNVTDM